MLAKSSLLYGLMKCKCPQCHEGNLFKTSNPYQLKKMLAMHQKCTHCGLYFEQEPGFWTGAMYVSYGFIVLLVLLSLVLLHISFNQPIEVVLGVNVGIVLFTYPLLLRYSRVLYLYLFVRFKNTDEMSR
ncbi:MAG: hypothetical protein RL060_979 [Bacteroidota bacterium]|jgi:uncharacterized protein (DUF983 family)